MTKEQAIERLKRIDIKYFLSARMEQSNYIIDETDKTNKAIETVLSMLEQQDKIIDLMSEQLITPIHDKKWIKKYYENKVNGGNER